MNIKDGKYVLYKLDSTNEFSKKNIKEGLLMDSCEAFIGKGKCLHCSLTYHSDLAPYTWFVSSTIKDLKNTDKGYLVYTLNSIYELVRINEN